MVGLTFILFHVDLLEGENWCCTGIGLLPTFQIYNFKITKGNVPDSHYSRKTEQNFLHLSCKEPS